MISISDIPAVLSRWLHLGAVIVAVGGTVFVRLVLHDAVRKTLPDRDQSTLLAAVLARWTKILHVCIGLIILSGTYNAILMFARHKGQPLYHSLFGVKVLLAFTLFFLAIAITGRSRVFEGLRRKRPMWMAVNVGIAAAIVAISGVLKFLPGS